MWGEIANPRRQTPRVCKKWIARDTCGCSLDNSCTRCVPIPNQGSQRLCLWISPARRRRDIDRKPLRFWPKTPDFPESAVVHSLGLCVRALRLPLSGFTLSMGTVEGWQIYSGWVSRNDGVLLKAATTRKRIQVALLG